jgi:hypothetical protein
LKEIQDGGTIWAWPVVPIEELLFQILVAHPDNVVPPEELAAGAWPHVIDPGPMPDRLYLHLTGRAVYASGVVEPVESHYATDDDQ